MIRNSSNLYEQKRSKHKKLKKQPQQPFRFFYLPVQQVKFKLHAKLAAEFEKLNCYLVDFKRL